MKKQYRIVTLMIACLLVISGCTTQKSSPSSPIIKEETKVEQSAPDFTFTDFNGEKISLSDFTGKKVYIKFWASWCPVCLKTLGDTEELTQMDRNFEVITVVAPSVSGEKSKEVFKKWFEELNYPNIKVLFDEEGTYMRKFGVRAFPTSAYIDENGGLIKVKVGYDTNQNIINSFQ